LSFVFLAIQKGRHWCKGFRVGGWEHVIYREVGRGVVVMDGGAIGWVFGLICELWTERRVREFDRRYIWIIELI